MSGFVRTCRNAVSATYALVVVNVNESILSLVRRSLCGTNRHAGWIVALHAWFWGELTPDFRIGPEFLLLNRPIDDIRRQLVFSDAGDRSCMTPRALA